MPIINEPLYLTDRPKQQSQTGQNILGKDDFLKILITQLQNQDPSNPMDDREFIAQMAQFSSLEQMTNMSQNMERFINIQTSQSLVNHSELIGKQVKWSREVEIDKFRSRTEYLDNIVNSVKIDKNGKITIELDNGRWISNEQLVQVSQNNQVKEDLIKEKAESDSQSNLLDSTTKNFEVDE
ncbi:flagellar hook assembly protein FlgD [Bacillus sp. FJAT-45350]|uniref:flagellar hook assembly protein FlgD n=1 Tax=Bacillus sp. FJAT-45350 TaxID=2011014 RepID=UPI000BB868E4|nr:flagellar hook assembly protein FlgD [Bacillus sp. FJAT-45350]